MQVDTTGLKQADSDMPVVLLKSLPEAVKNYVLHHSSGHPRTMYRNAVRCEEQHRLFDDFESTGSGKKLNSLEGNAEYYSLEEFGVGRRPMWKVREQKAHCRLAP